jgi:hypothetical protein
MLVACGGSDGANGTPGSAGLQGPAGEDGENGEPGADGEDGEPGEEGEPGEDGAPGVDGAPGLDGDDGATILTGTGAPANTLGNDGDLYLDTVTRQVYQKVSGSWTEITNLSSGTPGADGEDGVDGEDGEDGADGSKWLTGSGSPSAGTGANGDVYLDEDTGAVWTKANGTWSLTSTLDVATFLDAEWWDFANGNANASITENTPAGIQATLDGAANGNAGIGFNFAKYGNVSFDPASTLEFRANVNNGESFLVNLAGLWGDAGCSFEFAGTGALEDYSVDLAELISNSGDSICWGTGFSLSSVNAITFTTEEDAGSDFTIRVTEIAFVQ